ncbi:MAG: 16S rRNA (guanine(966)-N(2))-methyltransferase RsmD [Candidatus Omnitrophica bacterium]|nr:16S rRNA (guanine(966)-N(2))-methyltransferase RsmD [Candidatus Omnitrophota bacterium]
MRIISGKHKGRIIKMPGGGIRPTQNKARKGLFDILGNITGLSFLELFAGSGAIGLEALSAGAREAVFVEKDSGCREKIKENLEACGLSDPRIIALDVFVALKKLGQRRERFDIIFLDPPYHRELAKKTLQSLSACDILAPAGFVIVQHFKKDNLPDKLGDLTLVKQARYGDTILSFYRRM